MQLSKKRKAAILDRMIELLDRPYGWTKGTWRRERKDGTVQFCLLGAAQQAYLDVTGKKTKDDGGRIADALSIATLARAKNGGGGSSPSVAVFTFNDAKTTKKRDVLALLRERREQL